MKTKQKILLHLLLGLFFIALGIGMTSAQAPLGLQTPEQVPGQFRTLPQIIKLIFNITIYGSGIAFIILFLVGGIQYLGAAGNEEALNKAKKLLINSVIGLIIVLASWAIGTFIINALYGRVPSINIPSAPGGGGATPATTPPESTPTGLPTIPDEGEEQALPTVSISADKTSIKLGERATISWESSNAKICEVTKSSVSVEGWASGPVELSGSRSVKPIQEGNYTFTITCTAQGGKEANDNESITVTK